MSKKWWTLYDNIHDEIIDFSYESDCCEEAERRLNLYCNGYWIGDKHIAAVDAVMVYNKANHSYIVTYRGGNC